MKCTHCQNKFERKQHNQKYCSIDCRLDAGVKRHALRTGVGTKKRNCKLCGREFGVINRTFYCSTKCRTIAERDREAKRTVQRSCKRCKKAFVVKIKSSSRHCSNECKQASRQSAIAVKRASKVVVEKRNSNAEMTNKIDTSTSKYADEIKEFLTRKRVTRLEYDEHQELNHQLTNLLNSM